MKPKVHWGALTLLLSLGATAPSFADPPPWAGRWDHNKHFDGDADHDRDHNHKEWKRRDGEHRGRDGRCREIVDRIRFNDSKIHEIAPTGRHRKALQWYKDDNVNAHRDLDGCRAGR